MSDGLEAARKRISELEAEVQGALGVMGYLASEAGELRIPASALLENFEVATTFDERTDERVYRARRRS